MVRKTNNLLTTKELCEKYGVSRQAVNGWLNRGLPHYKLGPKTFKYDEVTVEQWLLKGNARKVVKVDK